jgi:hypothetical protein
MIKVLTSSPPTTCRAKDATYAAGLPTMANITQTSIITLIVCRPIVVMLASLGAWQPLGKLPDLPHRPARPWQGTCGGCGLNADYLKKSWRLRRVCIGIMSAASSEANGTSQLTT